MNYLYPNESKKMGFKEYKLQKSLISSENARARVWNLRILNKIIRELDNISGFKGKKLSFYDHFKYQKNTI